MGDYGRHLWPKPWKPYDDVPYHPVQLPGIYPAPLKPYDGPTREQFEEFLKLLRAARKFDVATGQKDCPAEDKLKWLTELAKYLGIDPTKVAEALK